MVHNYLNQNFKRIHPSIYNQLTEQSEPKSCPMNVAFCSLRRKYRYPKW